MLFVALTQSSENLNGVLNRRFSNHDGLEASFKGSITLNVFAVLIEGGGSDALKFASCQGRFENVCCIDGTFSGTCANQGMHFVNHKNDIPG